MAFTPASIFWDRLYSELFPIEETDEEINSELYLIRETDEESYSELDPMEETRKAIQNLT